MTMENSNGTLESILLKVRADKARQEDYVAPTRDLQFQTKIVEDGPNQPQIVLERNGGMPTKVLDVNDVAFQQISSKANLHVNDTRRLVENYGEEFDPLMNRIWQKEDKGVMVRTYADEFRPERGLARAFVSDSFRCFDNHHFLEASLPQLRDSDAQWQVVNGTITEKKLYLRLRSLVHVGEAKLNDPQALGLLLSNSEVGHGAINVQQLIWTLMCLNGMETQNKTRSTHLQSSRGENFYGLLTDEAKSADSHALSLRIRDVITSFARRESFDVALEKMRNAHEDGVEAKPVDAISALTSILKLPKASESKILDGFMATLQQPGYNDGRISRATLVNSVTAVANQPETHEDDKQDWMRLGAKVLELPRAAWRQVAQAEPVALAA
jgi:hypothetical protein